MSVNFLTASDCHASGSVPYIATAVREDSMLKWCGHCLSARRLDQQTHLQHLISEGWTIWPLQRAKAFVGWFQQAGTEGTPRHFALDDF